MLLLLLDARNVILKHGALGKCKNFEYNFFHVRNCGISKHVHSTQDGEISRSRKEKPRVGMLIARMCRECKTARKHLTRTKMGLETKQNSRRRQGVKSASCCLSP